MLYEFVIAIYSMNSLTEHVFHHRPLVFHTIHIFGLVAIFLRNLQVSMRIGRIQYLNWEPIVLLYIDLMWFTVLVRYFLWRSQMFEVSVIKQIFISIHSQFNLKVFLKLLVCPLLVLFQRGYLNQVYQTYP